MTKVVLSADVGYGNVKVVWGPDCTSNNEIIFRSIANQILKGNKDQSDATPGHVPIVVDGDVFMVGPDACQSTGTSITDYNYIARKEYLALLRGAIHFMFCKTGVHNRIDLLVVGLPVGNYEAQKDTLLNICKGEHIIPTPPDLIKQFGMNIKVFVNSAMVIPQPIGALSVFASKCARTNMNMGSALIIDVGFKTLDWVFSHGMGVDMERSGSFAGGISVLLREVSNIVGKKIGVGYIDLFETEKALSNGKIFADGRTHDFTPYTDVVIQAADKVIDKFYGALNLNREFTSIVLTGGGGKYFRDSISKKFPTHVIQYEEDSVMDNARGFYQVARGSIT